MLKRMFLATTVVCSGLAPANAKDLTIGMRIDAVPDPHYFWSGNYIQYYRHYLGFLTSMSTEGKVEPYLATSYEPVENGWVFHLRPGVKFTDGTDFDAADVIASYERARDYPKAAGSYAGLFKGVTALSAPDPLTVKFTTSLPYTTLPFALTQIPIIPSEMAETATQEDFQTAKANISVGPYTFDSYTAGQALVLKRNPTYFGEPAEWDSVTFRFMTDPAARVAAILAGDVDIIDGVPPEFVDRIRADENLALHVGPSMRDVFLTPDQWRDNSPYIRDNDGKPMEKNPLKDKRVREALSLAINREAIKDRVMNGLSFPSGQVVTKGTGGWNETIPVPAYDPAKAKGLLKDAGYPDGFQVTLQCTNDRYVNDAKICQAVGQMFARIGVKTEVSTMPSSAFFSEVMPSKGTGLSLALLSWSAAASGEADMLSQVIQTHDTEAKTGTWNLGRYSNPEIDQLIDQAFKTVDADQRQALQAKAIKMAMDDVALIPLHDQSVVVASKQEIEYTTSPDEATLAMNAHEKD